MNSKGFFLSDFNKAIQLEVPRLDGLVLILI